jgi:CHAT domain-containing protein
MFVVRQLGTKIEVSHIISRYGFTDLMVDVDLLEELSRGAPSEALDAFLDITLEKLYAELFAPVEPYLPDQTEKITFIPYSGFHLLPLHAMFTEHNGRREYLIDKYLVTYAPSVKILKHCELLERSRNGKVFVAAANPRRDLRYSPQEAQNVAALFGTQVNEKSRRQDILYEGRNAHVFHYTGHGNGQALILHGDGHDSDEDVFEAADVFATLDLPQAWLVTLSACETGKVKLGKTDEYIGLPSAFIHAGAATVISSLWCVSDRSTTLLMRKMYDLIRSGRGKAESLREAQLWLRDLHTSDDQMQELMGLVPGIGESPKDVSRFSRTRTSAATLSVEDLHKPYYWAGFICTGAP